MGMTSANLLLAASQGPPEMTSGACPRCGVIHSYVKCFLLPKIVPLCDTCEVLQANEMDQRRQHEHVRSRFLDRLPVGYHFAVRDRVPMYLDRIFAWDAELKFGGLGMVGPSGIGKSHAMACVLRDLDIPFRWWSGTDAREAATLASTAERNRDEAMQRWDSAKTVRLLVLDDISQGVMTAAWSSKLFDLLEGRLGARLPTFWTSQIPLEILREKIIRQNGGDAEQATAISRRLGQHSLVLTGPC